MSESARVSLSKDQETAKRPVPVRVVLAFAAVAVAVSATLWAWRPWVDRSPFTAYDVGVANGEYTVPGSAPGSCVRTAASEEKIVIFDEDGKKLAEARQAKEGKLLGREFGDFAGDCMFTTRIDAIPGGKGTYLQEWGGGTRHEMSEEELRLPPETRRERFKTMKKED